MGKKILIPLVVIAALVLGVGGGYFAAKGMSARASELLNTVPQEQGTLPEYPYGQPGDGWYGRGMSPWDGQNGIPMGPGMMWDDDENGQNQTQTLPASMDEAITAAKEYAANISADLQVTKVMEFSNGYYALVMEKDGDKGAFGLYLRSSNSVNRRGRYEYHMWNTKYTPRGIYEDADTVNAVSMADAAKSAQDALDKAGIKATVDAKGVDFYGYYTFTYLVDGKTAGLISVNGTTSQAWNYDWLGTYVSQQEVK